MTEEVTSTAPAQITINQEYSNLVPPLSAEEYESLKQSIKQNGLWVPIIVNSQGVILDGHHRFKASQELGIEPKTVTNDFPDKLHEQIFVIDLNLQRRHLNNFQRTELALKSKLILQQIARRNQKLGSKVGNNTTSLRNLTQVDSSGDSSSCGSAAVVVGRVDDQIAKRAGVSRDTVRKVEAIEEAEQQKPELRYIVERARSGQISTNEAHRIINNIEDESEQQGKWYKLREQVLKENDYKCRECGSDLHVDVYTRSQDESKHLQNKLFCMMTKA